MESVERAVRQWDEANMVARKAWELLGTSRDCLLCGKEFVFEQVELIDFDDTFEKASEMLRIIKKVYSLTDSGSDEGRAEMLKHTKGRAFKDLVSVYYELLAAVQGQAHMILTGSGCDDCYPEVARKKTIKKGLARRKELLPPGYHLQVVK